MMRKLVLGIAVCCGISGVNGMAVIEETLSPSIESSSCEVSETPDNSSDDDMSEEHTLINKGCCDVKSLSKLACDAVANKDRVYSLINALSDDSLSADIIEHVYWGLQSRKHDYTEPYDDFMEILNLLGMVHCAKCDGRCLQKELLLNAYNRGAFKEIETGGPFDEFEP